LYGIKNIGAALNQWNDDYGKFKKVLKPYNLSRFPESPAKFAGYVIVNARKRSDSDNKWQLSKAAYRYAERIPEFVKKHIPSNKYTDSPPIGGTHIMHSHAGMPSVSQNHHVPMWEVPNVTKNEDDDYFSVMGSRRSYTGTESKYKNFANDLISRIESLY
jgi:hypothetical protein